MQNESWFWGTVTVLTVVAHSTLPDSIRVDVLRGILILAAAGETLAGSFSVLRPRWFSERNGRPYDPAYHGVSQDFGLYNFAVGLLLVLAAVDPRTNADVIGVAILLYVIHGVTHFFRYFGLYYGGGTPIPTRPQAMELRDGLQLMAAATGMALFFP